jgi:hypothetical protein
MALAGRARGATAVNLVLLLVGGVNPPPPSLILTPLQLECMSKVSKVVHRCGAGQK